VTPAVIPNSMALTDRDLMYERPLIVHCSTVDVAGFRLESFPVPTPVAAALQGGKAELIKPTRKRRISVLMANCSCRPTAPITEDQRESFQI
jgi:hypothetical protein